MGWFTAIIVFLLIWWLTLFTVLPWGVIQNTEIKEGQDPGAPERPELKKKFLITTFISMGLWCVVYLLVEIQIIDFHGISMQMMEADRQ